MSMTMTPQERQLVRLFSQALRERRLHPQAHYFSARHMTREVSLLVGVKISLDEVSFLLDRMGIVREGRLAQRSKKKLRRRLETWLPAALEQDAQAVAPKVRLRASAGAWA